MAMLKLEAPELKKAIDQQTDKWLCENYKRLHLKQAKISRQTSGYVKL